MKISKIIDELTELTEYIGNKDLEGCTVDAMTGVNVMYQDEGGWTSTSLEGEKAKAELKATMSDQEAKGPTMEHSVYSRLDADKYMDWQANRIKQLEKALRQERDRFQPNGWSEAFTEMFETSVKSAVNDSLTKIETACVSALDKFCRQLDPSAFDGQ